MIKKEELRIGNFIFDLSIDRMVKVSYYKNMWQVVQYENHFDPIHLTPEILEGCGFEKDEDGEYNLYFGNDTLRWVKGNDNDWFFIFQDSPGCDFVSFYQTRSLHQLQNLYFALTAEELTVNLKEKELSSN